MLRQATHSPQCRSTSPASFWLAYRFSSLLCGVQRTQKQLKDVAKQMDRYVVPRSLTEEQIAKFGSSLRTNSGKSYEVTIRYVLGDSEAARYAESFAQAFRAGNWFPTISPINPTVVRSRPIGNGSQVYYTEVEEMVNSLEGVLFRQTGPNPPTPITIEEKILSRT
jgi:hypothetical protein